MSEVRGDALHHPENCSAEEQELRRLMDGSRRWNPQRFITSLRPRSFRGDLGSACDRYRFDIAEVISNLSRTLSMPVSTHEELIDAIDDALSGSRPSLTTISLPDAVRGNLRRSLIEKVVKDLSSES